MDPETLVVPSPATPPASPTTSSCFEEDSTPAVATNELGMIADDELELENGSPKLPVSVSEAVPTSAALNRTKGSREPRKHVSRHFKISKPKPKGRPQTQSPKKSGVVAHGQVQPPDGLKNASTLGSSEQELKASRSKSRQRQPREKVSGHFKTLDTERQGGSPLTRREKPSTKPPTLAPKGAQRERRAKAVLSQSQPQPPPQILKHPRIINGLDIDEEFSSDSSLTSVPSDIGPDPFLSTTHSPTKVLPVKTKRGSLHPTKSPYFPQPHRHKPRPTFISSILPFPALSSATFGLMQERLAHDPFRLLIATIFLNKTPGARAMPVFYDLMARYPTPHALAAAQVQDVVEIIRCLGFQNQRARKCVALAQTWVSGGEPVRGKRYAKRDYPRKGDGKGIITGDWVAEEDGRVAWEISHLPGVGAYAHDSWRMFCRDVLRGLAKGWNGEGADVTTMMRTTRELKSEGGDEMEGRVKSEPAHPNHRPGSPSEPREQEEAPFEPEWKRVHPSDKELRAWMTWMWLKEGWVWNYKTGERVRASDELLSKATGGGVLREELERDELVVEGLDGQSARPANKEVCQERLDRPAGAFMAESLADSPGERNHNAVENGFGERLDTVLDPTVPTGN